jgi:subtilase family protein/carboxypeptidase family protein
MRFVAALAIVMASLAAAVASVAAVAAPLGAALAAPAPHGAGSLQWVFFRDHGAGASRDSALAAATRSLTPRALERRAKAIRERGGEGSTREVVDERDLEPSAAYIAAIQGTGASVRSVSRWLNAVSIEGTPQAIAAVAGLPFVDDLRPVRSLTLDRALTADEFSYGSAAHQLEMLGVPEAHAMGYRGEGVLICVLDSGFELGHEAFDQLEVRATRDFVFHDEDVSFSPKQDFPGQSNHGTTVLSVLAGYAPGKIMGPAYRADFILAKTERIGSETRLEEDSWCEGIEWAEAMGADIAASSLSYPFWYAPQERDGRTALITRVANIASERGLLIVNSMGNTGPLETSLNPPADAPGVISVGAVDWNGRLAGFSSIGPTWDGRVKPELVAMGSGVALVTARSRDQYGHGSGTSYSSPLVAGCAALVLCAHPDWGPEAVRDALMWSGDRASHPDNRYGWGVPNVRDAILYPFVEGKIADATTREPIAGARVRWEPAGQVDSTRAAPGDSPPRGSVDTDSTGSYVAPNLPPGLYRLRVEAPGYADAASELVEVPPSLGDVNIMLRFAGK